jgi:Alw26I/Eco31I/Esp3I family type II restriction m6 adenine DNA methyltransferase
LAATLHRSAAVDLVTSADWAGIGRDGPLDDLLAHRTRSTVPSVHISRAAAKLATAACLSEMRRRAIGSSDGFPSQATALVKALPRLVDPQTALLASRTPTLGNAARALRSLNSDELVRVLGRVYEVGQNTFWIFKTKEDEPKRVWDSSRAKQFGCFFTPEFVARYLASAVRGCGTVLDPAVGGGSLLLERVLLEPPSSRSGCAARLFGVDRSEELVELAAVSLAFASESWDGLTPRLRSTNFAVADALVLPITAENGTAWYGLFPGHEGPFDGVVMNPPFVQLKINHSSFPARPGDGPLGEQLREVALGQLRQEARDLSVSLAMSKAFVYARGGVPDLPRFFMERALQVLTSDGVLACIVPSTFLSDHRSGTLRKHLLDQHAVDEVSVIPESARLFKDVNQPTCTVLVRKGAANRAIRIRPAVDKPEDFDGAGTLVARRVIESLGGPSLRIPLAANATDWRVLKRVHLFPSLAEDGYLINRRGELDLTIDVPYVRRSAGLRLVRGDQVAAYRDDIKSEKASRVSPAFLSRRCSEVKRRHVDRARVVVPQCSYLKKTRRLAAALVPPGVVVANSCNYLVTQHGGEPDLVLDYALGLLNSKLLEWRFRLTSSTNHVGNYELDALPWPEYGGPESVAVARAARRVRRSATPTSMKAVDAAVYELFGLSPRDVGYIERCVT